MAFAVVLVSTLSFLLRRWKDDEDDDDIEEDTKGSRASGYSSKGSRRSPSAGTTDAGASSSASVSSNIVMINNVGVEVPVVSWNDLVIDDQNPVLGRGSFGFVFRGMWLDPEVRTWARLDARPSKAVGPRIQAP